MNLNSMLVDNAMEMVYPLAVLLLCGCVIWALLYCVTQSDHKNENNDDDHGCA